jgi:hypothetical protein
MQYLTAGTLDLVPPLTAHTDQQRSASGLRLPLKPLPVHAKSTWETVGDATSGAGGMYSRRGRSAAGFSRQHPPSFVWFISH